MSSGSIQIAAQGMQDVFLNGTPDVSYFTGVFRRHSTFLLQSAEYPFDTPVQFGGTGKVKIPYRGDLLLGTTLKVTLPTLFTPGKGWVYPLATNSDYVPWIKDQATLAKIRTNLPTFKTYFSDGANTITYINRSVAYYNTYSPYSASTTANVAFSNVLNYPITYSSTPVTVTDKLSSVTLVFDGFYSSAPYNTSQVIIASDQSTFLQGQVTACSTSSVSFSPSKIIGTGINDNWVISLFSTSLLIAPTQNVIGTSYSSNVVVTSVGKSTAIVTMDNPQNIRQILVPQVVNFVRGTTNICQANITSSTRTVPQLIRLICIQSTNGSAILNSDKVTGLPYTGNVIVQETFTNQQYASNGISFNYNTVDVLCLTDQIIQPITTLTPVSFVRAGTTVATANIISPSCIPWVRNDFMYVIYNPTTSTFTWKTIYPIVKPITSVSMNVSNASPISVGMNISGISTLTGNVTVSAIQQPRNVTPTRFGSAEYFSLPGTTTVKLSYTDTIVATSNINYIQYPSQFDYSVVNIGYQDFRFQSGVIVKYLSNSIGLGTVLGFTGYQNQILTLFDTQLPPVGGSLIPVSIYFNLNIFAVANLSVNNSIYITTTNFPPSAVLSNVTILPGLLVTGLPVQTTDVKTASNTFTSNIITATISSQPVVPISTNTPVTFSNTTASVSGNVSYTYFSNPVTISKLAFPSQQSCVFWGCDPAVVTFTGAR